MITKNFIKTIVAGLLHRIKANEISDEDVIEILYETDALPTLSDKDGNILADKDGAILFI